jgi:hypothetical protein
MKRCPYCQAELDDFDITCDACKKMVVTMRDKEPTASASRPAAPSAFMDSTYSSGGYANTSGSSAMGDPRSQFAARWTRGGEPDRQKSVWGKMIGLCVIIGILGGVYYGYQQSFFQNVYAKFFGSWVTYRSQDLGFAASFPDDPEHTSYEAGGSVVDEHGYRDTTMAYRVRVMTFESSIEYNLETGPFLDEAVLALAGQGDQIMSTERTTVAGKQAIDFVIGNGTIMGQGRIVVDNTRMYIIAVTARQTSFDNHNADKFINSFKLID